MNITWFFGLPAAKYLTFPPVLPRKSFAVVFLRYDGDEDIGVDSACRTPELSRSKLTRCEGRDEDRHGLSSIKLPPETFGLDGSLETDGEDGSVDTLEDELGDIAWERVGGDGNGVQHDRTK